MSTSSEPLPDAAERRPSLRALAAPIAAIAIFGMSLSMSYPLFSILLDRAGASATAIGLNAMAAAIAIVIFAPMMPLILAKVGIGRLMIGSAVLMVVIFVLVALWESIWWWAALRLFYGFAATAMFFTSEFWIVAVAPDAQRGRIVAIYAVILSGSFMLGPLLLGALGAESTMPFLVAATITALGIAPILWGLSAAPRPDPGARRPQLADCLRFYVTDPALVWAVVLFGAIEFGALALMGVWGLRVGLTAEEAVQLLAIFAAGAMVLQIPIGWTADRFPARTLLAIAAALTLGAPLAMVVGAPAFLVLVPAMAIWGGCAPALYTIALTALGKRYSGERLASATAAVILGYGIGALLAPGLLGLAMDLSDPHGLLYGASAMALAYLGLVLARLVAARRANTP